MHYLLDTNICIYLIKKRPPGVLERFRENSPQDVGISTITFFELQYGVEKINTGSVLKMPLPNFFCP